MGDAELHRDAEVAHVLVVGGEVVAAEHAVERVFRGQSLSGVTWAKLIKRVYEVDPLLCPECGTTMKVISFIEPPQQDVIEKILKHCGLWEEPARGPPAQSATADRDNVERALAETELTYVPIDEFLAEW